MLLLRRAACPSLPVQAPRPWLFLDVLLPPRHVEVNLHPTKREVGFLHQVRAAGGQRAPPLKCPSAAAAVQFAAGWVAACFLACFVGAALVLRISPRRAERGGDGCRPQALMLGA